jgi:lipopolysaccharide/colanic/teichoic acid biosynthesis glycosyltransferase
LIVQTPAATRSHRLQRAVKRLVELAIVITLLILATPLLITLALIVRLTSPGPALFRQVRIGRHARPFVMYKFRTMRDGAEDGMADLRPHSDVPGPLFKLREDPRVTRVGRVLRTSSLDELPQLLNVLIGHMSLVGPRPLPVGESAAVTGWAEKRFDVRPGMTGQWQVSGRNDIPFAEMQRIDHRYVAHWNLWTDAKILARTPAAVITRRGVY